jgi:DNA helicase-2/ATP-dependent DNA helicase PcrA
MKNLLEKLNLKQREAVLKTEGPVIAIAGAGSGKTSVLTTRIAYLIFEKNVHYENILAITFTNKAANEMKHRVHEATGINTSQMWISTFHSMCAKILREHIEFLGYKRNFQIIDDDDVNQLIKSILKKSGYDIKVYNPKIVKGYVLKLKFDISLLSDIEEPFKSVVKIVFKKYQNNLLRNNLVDFEDLLVLTIKLLETNDELRKYYTKKFQYILVDEFQDTNNVQYRLISLLVGENKNLFIVGDEDQSIYAFRGANIENINKFKREYPDYHLVLLEENYRSSNTILSAANQIIKNNSKRVPKTLFSNLGDGAKIVHFKGVTARDEVEFVALKIMKLARQGYKYNDFAILYRANSTSRVFEEVFMQKQIPYRIYGNTSFFKRREIKDFTAYLRLIVNFLFSDC